MVGNGEEIGQWMRSRRKDLSEEITRRHFKNHPELESRFGPAGKQRCLEDALYHLDYLTQAMQMTSPKLFYAYVAWAKTLLAGYGIGDQDLVDHLHTTQEVLAEVLPEAAREQLKVYVAEALNQLSQTDTNPPSYIPSHNPYFYLTDPYLAFLLNGDREGARRLIIGAIENGVSLEKIYLEVLQPVQYEIGRLWQTHQISVAQEHLSTAITQFVMSQLYPQISKPGLRTNRMVLTSVGDELHEVGARMVADLCELNGWHTYYLGGNTPINSVVEMVQKIAPQVLGISTTMGFHLHKVTELIQGVRALNFPVKIMVGGALFNLDQDLWRAVGADGYAHNAKLAVTMATDLVQQG